MTGVWALAALWLGLALIASLLSIWLRISTALSEIVVGTIAQLIIGAAIGSAVLGTDESWVKFLSGIGAIVLTFLAGAELDPAVFKLKWKEAAAVGLAELLFSVLRLRGGGAYYVLGWELMPSWLAGVAMSTTSVAVVYAVMIEFGFNTTEYGKTVLAACFVTDLGTVVALGLIFAPFTMKTLIFLGVGGGRFRNPALAHAAVLPALRQPAIRTGNQVPAALPARHGRAGDLGRQRGGASRLLIGMVLAGTVGQGSCARSAVADPDIRVADAVLFHPRRIVRLDPRAYRRAVRLRLLSDRQDRHQDRRRLSRHRILQVAESRRRCTRRF